jgi:hypothetical protein
MIAKTRPQGSTQLEEDDDMEYEYEDETHSPRHYESEFGYRDWSSFTK